MNLLFALLTILLKILYYMKYPLIWWRTRKSLRRKVTSVTEPLLKISATDLAEKIRKKELSSETICKLYIGRIKEVNPILNAVVQDRFESALEEAKRVDAFLQAFTGSYADLELNQPLLGVPLTVKESCSLAGSSFCVGTLTRVGVRADTDGEAIANLRAAGAIPLLVSNTPEICFSWECSNFVTGATNNPYDTTKTSAGSSGGEGALLGAGASLLGVGSDVAGSVRLPAMFNGVYGHKPTPRTIPVNGHFPTPNHKEYMDVFVVGPMVRYAKDLKLMMNTMAFKSVLPSLRLDENVDLSKLKVYYMTEEENSLFHPKVAKEIKSAIKESVEYLKTECSTQIMENYKFPLFDESCEIGGVFISQAGAANLLKSENTNLPLEIIKSLIGQSKLTFNLLFFYLLVRINMFIFNDCYLQKNEQLKKLFKEKLGDDGVLIYPTFVSAAVPHNTFWLNPFAVSYMMIVNSLGLPSTHVPCGLNKDKMPYGFQVIAGPNQDRLCFAVAEELEKKFGGWQSP